VLFGKSKLEGLSSSHSRWRKGRQRGIGRERERERKGKRENEREGGVTQMGDPALGHHP
jgi:hypothetical protein